MRVRHSGQTAKIVAKAEAEFSALGDRMLAVAETAAAGAKAGDPYQDRTTNLRKSTQALRTSVGDPIVIELEMDMPYASYVVGLGYSFFPDHAEFARQIIAEGIASMKRRIG